MVSPSPQMQGNGNMIAEMIPEFEFGGAGSRARSLDDLEEDVVPFGTVAAEMGKTDVGFGWFGAYSAPETVRMAVRPAVIEARNGCGAPLMSDAGVDLRAAGVKLPDFGRGPQAVQVAAAGAGAGAGTGAGAGVGVAARAGSAPASHPLVDFLEIAQSIGRKIPHCYENPVDNVLIDINEHVNPIYFALGMVPNHVTLLSAVFGVWSVVALTRGAFTWAGILYMISYYFDVADGNYARAYKMVSRFGDLLDHGKDVLVVIALYWVILFRLTLPVWFKVAFFAVQALLVAGMMLHLGCQENYYDALKKKKEGADAESESASLSGLRGMCFYDPETKMPVTRWIGCGTYAVITALSLVAMQWWVR